METRLPLADNANIYYRMKKLEAYKAFSFVAWATVILFSLFTYSLVLDLRETITALDERFDERQVIK